MEVLGLSCPPLSVSSLLASGYLFFEAYVVGSVSEGVLANNRPSHGAPPLPLYALHRDSEASAVLLLSETVQQYRKSMPP